MKYIIIFLVIICILVLFKFRESFFDPRIGLLSPPKRNISYDIRCEPRIPYRPTGAFHQSTIYPYPRRRCLVT